MAKRLWYERVGKGIKARLVEGRLGSIFRPTRRLGRNLTRQEPEKELPPIIERPDRTFEDVALQERE